MSRSYVVGVVLMSLLAFPSVSSAGVMDYIHAMSGPQMIGGIVHCKIYVGGGRQDCKVLDDVWRGRDAIRALSPTPLDLGQLRLSFETIAYLSSGTNAEGHDYRAFKIAMAAFDPVLEVGSFIRYKEIRFYHGVGASLNWLLVNDVPDFGNIGVKIRPVALTFPSPWAGVYFDVALNVRWYPDGFGSDQFGFGPRPDGDRKNERVYGFSWGFAW